MLAVRQCIYTNRRKLNEACGSCTTCQKKSKKEHSSVDMGPGSYFEGRGRGSTYNNYTLQIIHPAYMYMLAIQLIKGKVLRYIPAIMFTSNYN